LGTKGREIVGMDVEKLIAALNRAFADEWLAYYQYWIGAKVIKGPMRGAVEAELIEHAGEELEHANMLADRIIELGGTPLIDPAAWQEHTNCGYEVPADEFVKAILTQNIQGEQCAIRVYHELLDMVQGKDPVTFHILVEILEDEVTHEEELQALEEDLTMMMDRK
jgi:bacterioferritin